MLGMDLQDLVFAVLNIEHAVTQSFTAPPSWKKNFLWHCVLEACILFPIAQRSIVKRLFENQKDCIYTSEPF